MKKLYIGLAGLLVVLGLSFTAGAVDSPYPPWIENGIKGSHIQEQVSAGEASYGAKIARFIYDVAVDGGSATAHALDTRLPAGAVITRSYFKVITQFDNSGGTVAISCEDANNIKTATDISAEAVNAFVEGASTGAASAFKRAIAADCSVTATVATVAPTVGKLVGWIEYVVE